jgi:diadenylate cyclase
MATPAQPEFLEATYGSVCRSTRCDEKRRRTLESVVHLAVELAREGREGRKVGTLFVIGDVDNVLAQSRSLLLDPLYGHSEDVLHVERPEFRETSRSSPSSTAPLS